MRAELNCEPWKSRFPDYLGKHLPSTLELFNDSCPSPSGDWSDRALFQRDLDAIRLELLRQLISLEPSQHFTAERRTTIQQHLQSNDVEQINQARNLIRQISEAIFNSDIADSVSNREWDIWFEPDQATDQDVISISFRFRKDPLNRASARENFQCFWRTRQSDRPSPVHRPSGFWRNLPKSLKSWRPVVQSDTETTLEMTAATGVNEKDRYESGWDVQLVPTRGQLEIAPIVIHNGAEVLVEPGKIRPTPQLDVKARMTTQTPVARALRGLVDAGVTAIVPVLTVAVTQANGSGDQPWTTLIALGFTSQAIRAVIVPESANSGSSTSPAPGSAVPATPPPVSGGTQQTKPSGQQQ